MRSDWVCLIVCFWLSHRNHYIRNWERLSDLCLIFTNLRTLVICRLVFLRLIESANNVNVQMTVLCLHNTKFRWRTKTWGQVRWLAGTFELQRESSMEWRWQSQMDKVGGKAHSMLSAFDSCYQWWLLERKSREWVWHINVKLGRYWTSRSTVVMMRTQWY